MNTTLNNIAQWANINLITFGQDKSNIMLVSRGKHPIHLGIILDHNHPFNPYITQLISKSKQVAGWIHRYVRKTIHTIIIRQLIKSLLIPYISYSLPLIPLNKKQCQILDSIILSPNTHQLSMSQYTTCHHM